jgi:hypothetical protein
MTHQAFICYPVQDQDIVENLAGRLGDLGIDTWVYSLDRTLAEDVWSEIESKIHNCQLFIFIASKYSLGAQGQHRELKLAVDRLRNANAALRMVAILLNDISFSGLPEELSRVNGLRLDTYTVKSTAHDIARTFFPDLVAAENTQDWRYPKPGQWLEVSSLDQWIEEHFDIGDRVYFRRISPFGLFECYSPKLAGLFWFAPRNLRAADVVDEDGALERRDVPWSYRYSASYDFERFGLDEMRKQGRLE